MLVLRECPIVCSLAEDGVVAVGPIADWGLNLGFENEIIDGSTLTKSDGGIFQVDRLRLSISATGLFRLGRGPYEQ